MHAIERARAPVKQYCTLPLQNRRIAFDATKLDLTPLGP
jgi:hypothetical protein